MMPPEPDPAEAPARLPSHDAEAERLLLRALAQVREGKAFLLRGAPRPRPPRKPTYEG
jgi:hypothetical protein